MRERKSFQYFLVELIVIFLFIIIGFGFSPVTVYATVPCPASGCPPGPCSYQGCGNGCHCWDYCSTTQCPICVFDDCPSNWSNGGCNGASNCSERTWSCSCGNGSKTCHHSTTPPGPTNTPSPSPIPTSTPSPTPTPIQPTQIINFLRPSPGAFSQKAATDVQDWVCLQTTPCTTGGLICSGGDPQHRVRITTKTDAKLIPNKKTYIFECLDTGQGYHCTTGNGTVDQNLTGTDYLFSLNSTYGYRFVSLTDIQNRPIQQSSPDQVVITDSSGNFGPLEWESSTTTQVGRVMMAMQRVLENDNTGLAKTQQQGGFFFDSGYNTSCVMIKWDPHGTVFDLNNLKPIEGVKVTLLHKNKGNNFEPVKDSDIFNGLKNPQVTSNDGVYGFLVPDGTYKIKLEKEGYQPVFNISNINKKVSDAYPQIYDGGEIMTKGRLELRNLAMKKITIGDKVIGILKNVWLNQ